MIPPLLRPWRAVLALVVLAALVAPAGPLRAAENPTYVATLKQGLVRMLAGDWEGALEAAGAPGTVRRDIIEWHRLREGLGTFDEVRAFLARRPDWPGLKLLRKRSEASIGEIGPDVRAEDVVAFFAAEPPQTGHGSLRLAQALTALGRTGEARAEAVRGWTTLSMSAEEEAAYLAAFAPVLAGHHWARADMLLWQGQRAAAERLLPRLDKPHAALARARIALRAGRPGVDALIAALPTNVAEDPGLAYERALWRKRKGLDHSAAALIVARSRSAESLGRPEAWARLRLDLARSAMREGEGTLAWQLASGHHLPAGGLQPQLEWLAGYVALTMLDRPARARDHFAAMESGAFSPITLARQAYWLGRAYEALGEPDMARAAFRHGARFQTAFYGQLAAEKAGVPMTDELAGLKRYEGWRQAPFWGDSNMVAGRLLQAAGERYLALRFTQHLAERLSEDERGQLLAWAEAADAPYLQVKLAKYVLRLGSLFERPYFALTRLGAKHPRVPPELALAIARRESEFNPEVVSGAGARGLMQLMERTARAMAKAEGLPFERGRLTDDPAYNARLGVAYLAKLAEEFGQNPILLAAAYNAGPSRARRWMAQMGHPADPGVDPIDWIERIPFDETRNYVMRVTEGLAVYRARLAGKPVPFTLAQDLKRR